LHWGNILAPEMLQPSPPMTARVHCHTVEANF
jgi:hypothetical protein